MIEVQGEELRINQLLALLGSAAGLVLVADQGPTTIRITIAKELELGPKTSAALRARLKEMITDNVRAARMNLTSGAILFGVFGNLQLLNVATSVSVENDAPGMGIAIAVHEIWENYISRTGDNSQTPYGPAHRSALDVERVVVQELTGRTGGRVAAGTFKADGGDGYVLDYESYFLVLTPRPSTEWQEKGRLAAQVHGRSEPSSRSLTDVFGGQRVGQDRIAEVVGWLKDKRQATARVTGLRTAQDAETASAQRADAVRNAITVALKADSYAEDTGIELKEARSKGAGADLGARRAWTSSVDQVTDVPGVRIDIYSPV